MTVFLLIVSILFNFINLFIILIIWKKYSLSDLTSIERAKNDIEDLLIAYTDEMKDDNEKLMKMISSEQGQAHQIAVDIKTEEKKPEQNIDVLVDDPVRLEVDYSDNSIENEQIEDETDKASVKKSPVEEAILLSKQGLTHEEIAKKLGKGKGEIELLLKFHKE